MSGLRDHHPIFRFDAFLAAAGADTALNHDKPHGVKSPLHPGTRRRPGPTRRGPAA